MRVYLVHFTEVSDFEINIYFLHDLKNPKRIMYKTYYVWFKEIMLSKEILKKA